uniref:Protein phosphatase 1 regulatory subunit 14B n=1 Tax=Steinernema glaseri TaxID=37863 RepID=A0A1I7Z7I3_9BILA
MEAKEPQGEDLQSELRALLQACGGQDEPLEESVNELAHLLKLFLTCFLGRAQGLGKPGRISLEDIFYLVRRDPIKHQRIKELLVNQDRLKNSKKLFEGPTDE